jgi:hypothetical protein
MKYVLLVLLLFLLSACKIAMAPVDVNGHAPFCPNDSTTWVAADSVPLGCVRPF